MVHHRHERELVTPALVVQVQRRQVGTQQLQRRKLQNGQPEEVNVFLLACERVHTTLHTLPPRLLGVRSTVGHRQLLHHIARVGFGLPLVLPRPLQGFGCDIVRLDVGLASVR